ncbi:MAG: hypothetical protein GXO90_08435 [FCB group bacterium]|nr:hypothetical protein [FCB group bacterium]
MKIMNKTGFAIFLFISLTMVFGQEKPVIALMGFVNQAPVISSLTEKSASGEFTEQLAEIIRKQGDVTVRTPKDMKAINTLNELIQLGAVDESNPLLKLITLPRDKFGTILAEGADYLAFGAWSTTKNMIFQQASIKLDINLVNVETREIITVSEAVPSGNLLPNASPAPKGLANIDDLMNQIGKELNTVLFLPGDEREMRYNIRQINTELAARQSGKKFIMFVAGFYGPIFLLMDYAGFTFAELLVLDSAPFLVYLGLRDIYYGKEAAVRMKRLKKIYKTKFNRDL